MDTAVALIIFRRPELTARVFERIREARPPKLFVIADGPRPGNAEDVRLCANTRAVVEEVDWPCEVVRDFADENLGLKRRIPSGLDRVFEEVTEAIILEDDCLPDPSFFPYCEELLERYRDDERVIHISGSQLLPDPPKKWSYHFSRGPAVWGWATWRRAWELYDVELADWHSKSRAEKKTDLRRMFEEEDEQRHWRFVWDNSAGDRQLGRPVVLRRTEPGTAQHQPEPQPDHQHRLRGGGDQCDRGPAGDRGPPPAGDLASARAPARGEARRRGGPPRVPSLQAAKVRAAAARGVPRAAGGRGRARARARTDPSEDPAPGPSSAIGGVRLAFPHGFSQARSGILVRQVGRRHRRRRLPRATDGGAARGARARTSRRFAPRTTTCATALPALWRSRAPRW